MDTNKRELILSSESLENPYQGVLEGVSVSKTDDIYPHLGLNKNLQKKSEIFKGFDELLELIDFCQNENSETLTQMQKDQIFAFLEKLESVGEEEELKFVRVSGEYMENEWHPSANCFSPKSPTFGNAKHQKHSDTHCELENMSSPSFKINLKGPCSSPASVDDSLIEESPQMKELKNIFEETAIRCSDELFKEEAEPIDSFEMAKYLYKPPKYNMQSRPMSSMKSLPCNDSNENINDSVDFISTFQFQEWYEDDCTNPPRKPALLSRSDETTKIAQQMISYVNDIENNRYGNRVPEVFRRFWMETNAALGIETSNPEESGPETPEVVSIVDESSPTADILSIHPVNSNAVSSTPDQGGDESFDFATWNAETSSNYMATFPLSQNDQEPDDSVDDEDFRDFFMGGMPDFHQPDNAVGTFRNSRDLHLNQNNMDANRRPRFFEGLLPEWPTETSSSSSLRSPNQDDIPESFLPHSEEVGDINGLPQSLITSIEEYVDNVDEDSDNSTGNENEDDSNNILGELDEQVEVGDIEAYFTLSRVLRMPNGEIPPIIEVDEESLNISQRNYY